MRDILLAVALIWCLYNTWSLHHNFKQDRIANLLDKMTLKILQIHCDRLQRIEDELGIKNEK